MIAHTELKIDKIKALIVVPCYNEAARLVPNDFLRFADNNSEVGFLFVNDGSTDNTQALLLDLCEGLKEQGSTLTLQKNSGKAEAVRQGMLHGISTRSVQFIGYWDADLATPLTEVKNMMRVFGRKPHVKMVMGARIKLLGRDIQRRAARHYLGRIFATAASTILNLAVYDTQCGAKLFQCNKDILSKIFAEKFKSTWVFDVELIARLRNLLREDSNQRYIYELPLKQWHDIAGSKVKPWHFITAAFDLAKIYKHYPRIR